MSESPKQTSDLHPLRRTSENRELRMVRRAVKEGWEIPLEKKREIVEMVIADATDPDAKQRDRTQSVKALVAMEGQDLKRAELELKEAQGSGATQINIQNNLNIRAPEEMSDEELDRAIADYLANTDARRVEAREIEAGVETAQSQDLAD